jgi:uncharacterized membrane protein
MKKILHYLATFIFLIGIDLVWITLIVNKMYQEALFDILRTNPIIWSAVFAWILIPLGIVLFTVPKSKNIKQSLLYGALYGLILYGVYDFTNYSILGPYTLTITLADILWGTFLCSISTLFSWKIKKHFN